MFGFLRCRLLRSKLDDAFEVEREEGAEDVDVKPNAHVADTEEVELGHFEPVFDGLGFNKAFAGVDLLPVFIFGELGG